MPGRPSAAPSPRRSRCGCWMSCPPCRLLPSHSPPHLQPLHPLFSRPRRRRRVGRRRSTGAPAPRPPVAALLRLLQLGAPGLPAGDGAPPPRPRGRRRSWVRSRWQTGRKGAPGEHHLRYAARAAVQDLRAGILPGARGPGPAVLPPFAFASCAFSGRAARSHTLSLSAPRLTCFPLARARARANVLFVVFSRSSARAARTHPRPTARQPRSSTPWLASGRPPRRVPSSSTSAAAR